MILRDLAIQLLKDSPNQPSIILEQKEDKIVTCVVEGCPTGDIISYGGLWLYGCYLEGCECKDRQDKPPPNPVPIIKDTVFKNCKLPDGAYYSNCVIKNE